MKKCSRCGIIKKFINFGKHSHKRDGFYSQCKECKRFSEYIRGKTKKGKLVTIYKDQIKRSKKRSYGVPTYSKEEFIHWGLNNNIYNTLRENRKNSGYNKRLAPSIDRINDYEGYNFGNIQIMTWGENKRKGHRDMKKGINNKLSKSILQYDLFGNLLSEYYSIKNAQRKTNINRLCISRCCNLEQKTAGGYIWKFK